MQNRENLTINEITEAIIGAAIEVHRTLGPGLLESAYQECLARELTLRQIAFEREKPLLLEYKGVKLECGYRLDFLVAGMVVVEVKAAESVLPVHKAQLLTYMKLGGWKVGLIINFHAPLLKNGIKRLVLGLEENAAGSERKTKKLSVSAVRSLVAAEGRPFENTFSAVISSPYLHLLAGLDRRKRIFIRYGEPQAHGNSVVNRAPDSQGAGRSTSPPRPRGPCVCSNWV